MLDSNDMLEVKQHHTRGRGLYTTRHVQGGETVLSEGPLLLTVAHAMRNVACAMCLRQQHTGVACSLLLLLGAFDTSCLCTSAVQTHVHVCFLHSQQ